MLFRSGAADNVRSLAGRSKKPASRAGAADLPIEGYDDLQAEEILPRLEDLGESELRALATHEKRNRGRRRVLARIEARLDGETATNGAGAR